MSTSAVEVIHQYAALTQRWQHPSPSLAGYISTFAKDVMQKRGMDAATCMFYPMRSVHDAEPWVQLVGKSLFTARVYQVTTEMCRVVTVSYQKTARDTTRVSFDELPAESGFIWLDEPVLLLDRLGKRTGRRAMSWEVTSADFDRYGIIPVIRLVTWADTRVADDWVDMWEPGVLEASEREFGRLQLLHVTIVPLDRNVGISSEDTSPLTDDHIAWFHALIMLMDTEVASASKAAIPPSATSKIKKSVKRPVTVVTLRQAPRSKEHAAASRLIEWTHRWLVQGHHRHLDGYDTSKHHATPLPHERGRCATCGARITWVRPFVKGPDGAPVKNADVVYRLSR